MAFSGKFTPPSGKVLLIIGQDLGSVKGYTDAIKTEPGGITTYDGLYENDTGTFLPALETTQNWGAGDINASTCLQRYPHSTLAIGLCMIDNTGSSLDNFSKGKYDAEIERLGRFIQKAKRPVYLRIGYEFDGFWNHYEPDKYKAVFRHLVKRLRKQGVENFASVWQAASSLPHPYQDLLIPAWYPGDDVVDWVGCSHFEFVAHRQYEVLDFAREHGKPVMIAEATSKGYEIGASVYAYRMVHKKKPQTAEEIWGRWYEPFFAYIHKHADIIRAIAYINCHWNSQAMWLDPAMIDNWGDSRVEANDFIKTQWQKEIQGKAWLHGGPGLFEMLGMSAKA